MCSTTDFVPENIEKSKKWGPENIVQVENGEREEMRIENKILNDCTPKIYHFLGLPHCINLLRLFL